MKKWLWIPLCLGVSASWADAPLIDLAAELEGSAPMQPTEPAPAQAEAERAPAAQPSEAPESAAAEQESEMLVSVQVPMHSEPAPWGYYNDIAPRFWGQLDERYSLCDHGRNQSPVDIRRNQAVGTQGLPGLDIAYRDVALRLRLSDHGLRGEYPMGSYIKLGEARYEFTHYQFHTPSEHYIDGFAYPLEIQLHHRDGDYNRVVLSVIAQEGRPNPVINEILNHLPEQRDELQIHDDYHFNPVRFLPEQTEFYRYIGSMTTPPCSEGVVWLVFKHPIEASVSQLRRLHDLMGDNVRPIQPLHGRLPLKSWSGEQRPRSGTPPPAGAGYYFDF